MTSAYFVDFASRLVFLSKGGDTLSKHHIKFRENGYNNFPEIVFWNLWNSKATPVPSDQSGVALVSGFSKNLVKLFLENGGIINPVAVMYEAISG